MRALITHLSLLIFSGFLYAAPNIITQPTKPIPPTETGKPEQVEPIDPKEAVIQPTDSEKLIVEIHQR